jgi:hypothetical protein
MYSYYFLEFTAIRSSLLGGGIMADGGRAGRVGDHTAAAFPTTGSIFVRANHR